MSRQGQLNATGGKYLGTKSTVADAERAGLVLSLQARAHSASSLDLRMQWEPPRARHRVGIQTLTTGKSP